GSRPSAHHALESSWRCQLPRAAARLRALMRNRMSPVGLVILILSSFVALAAPLITPYHDIEQVAGPHAQPEWVMNFPDGYYLSKNLVVVNDPLFSSPASLRAWSFSVSRQYLSNLILSYAPVTADP